jgi:hypothetical protein
MERCGSEKPAYHCCFEMNHRDVYLSILTGAIMWCLIVVTPKLKVEAIALYPFILIKNEAGRNNKILINHEQIHLRQELELLIIPFYLIYLGNYLFHRFKHKAHYVSYRYIIFEREAYANEDNLEYLNDRRFWSWVRYIS